MCAEEGRAADGGAYEGKTRRQGWTRVIINTSTVCTQLEEDVITREVWTIWAWVDSLYGMMARPVKGCEADWG